MNRLLIVAILVISTGPLFAQDAQSDLAKLKADAQKVVSVIKADKAKAQAYCEMRNLGAQIERAAQEKDNNKVEALIQTIDDVEKQIGPEYLALIDGLNLTDPNSKDAQEILFTFNRLDEESCPH